MAKPEVKHKTLKGQGLSQPHPMSFYGDAKGVIPGSEKFKDKVFYSAHPDNDCPKSCSVCKVGAVFQLTAFSWKCTCGARNPPREVKKSFAKQVQKPAKRGRKT